MPSETAAAAVFHSDGEQPKTVARADMTSRFLGLVVIPGHHITKIEVEERPVYGLPIRTGSAS